MAFGNAQTPERKSRLERIQSELGDGSERLSKAIDKWKSDLIRWIAGMMIVQGACIVALVKLLPGVY